MMNAIMLSVSFYFFMNVSTLSVIMLNVVMLSVVVPVGPGAINFVQ
jgi:hypothetical protein